MTGAEHPGVHVVVVLNWHGREDTLRCVQSLRAGSEDTEVLVVDNGSFDGTVDAVTQRWARVRTLQLGRNEGFTGGMNRGIQHAIDVLGARFVTVLNNDTVVPPGAMRALRAISGTGVAVSPEIRYLDDPGRLWFGGGMLDTRRGYPYHLPEDRLPGAVDGLRRTVTMTGCCITATADVWRRVGLFDEAFFLNFEDAEWSLRATEHGVPLVVATTVTISHAVSASFQRSPASIGLFYFLRNGLRFSRLAGAGIWARVTFLRRFAAPALRDGPMLHRCRHAAVVLYAMWCYLIGSTGPARVLSVRRPTARFPRARGRNDPR